MEWDPNAEGVPAGMPVGVPPTTTIPVRQLPGTPTPLTVAGKVDPRVGTGSIVEVKHEQLARPLATTSGVLVPYLQC